MYSGCHTDEKLQVGVFPFLFGCSWTQGVHVPISSAIHARTSKCQHDGHQTEHFIHPQIMVKFKPAPARKSIWVRAVYSAVWQLFVKWAHKVGEDLPDSCDMVRCPEGDESHWNCQTMLHDAPFCLFLRSLPSLTQPLNVDWKHFQNRFYSVGQSLYYTGFIALDFNYSNQQSSKPPGSVRGISRKSIS